MSTQIQAMTHGARGLELAYVLVLTGMLIGFIQARAARKRLLLSPLVAVPMTVVVLALTSLILSILGVESESTLQFGLGIAMTAVLGYVSGRVLPLLDKTSSTPEHRRGAIVRTAQYLSTVRGTLLSNLRSGPFASSGASRRAFWFLRHDPRLTLAGIPVPLEDETKHFKLIGTTGTGKSTAIREILTKALTRGDRAVIADPDGGYLSRFYDPARGDVILNPFDGDARKWDVFGEIVNDYDIDQLARSLIPDSGDAERIWCEYARTFFTAVVRQSIRGGRANDRELYRLLTVASVQELRMMLAGTAAGPFLGEGNEKMFGSLRSVATTAVRALEYTMEQQAELFSVRQWIRQGRAGQPGSPRQPGTPAHSRSPGAVLFLPYSAGQIAALRSTISAWMRLAIFEAMDREEEGDQRLWFVVDELDALGEIDGLKDALARLRKFGGRCVLGFQSIAQVSGTYGKGTAETIVENCANTLILRCSASEHGGTSEFASKLIGQREVIHTTRSKTRRGMQWVPSTTTSQQLKIEPAVMASEIERLPDLAGFLKLASVPDWQSVRLTPQSGPATVRVRRPPAPPVLSIPPVPSIPPSLPIPPATPAATKRPPRKRKSPTPRTPPSAQSTPPPP